MAGRWCLLRRLRGSCTLTAAELRTRRVLLLMAALGAQVADTDDPGTSADDLGADADDPGTSADDPGTDADEPGISVVCPGPALVSVTLGPVGASVVLKNGPCVREVGTTLDRVTIVVFKDVWVIVVAFAGVDVLKGRFVIAGFDDT
ncbi:hypothetical protein VE04_00465 [Pseudogymnoascus sp. 24MN13]|nr:hypothetical protein VE04_00465 [Pseudogymnoascus sp. 24MN13]